MFSSSRSFIKSAVSLSSFSFVAGCMLALAGCSSTPGNGVAANEKRVIAAPFSEIEINTVNARIVVDPTVTTTEIEVRGDSNLVPRVRTSVEDNVLVIDAGNDDVDPEIRLEVIFRTPHLGKIEATGESQVDITVNNDTQTLEVKAVGSSWITGHGKVMKLDAELAGSAHLEAKDLTARDAEVDAAGSSVVSVCATNYLDIELAGNSRGDYFCSPRNVDDDIDGSSHLNARQ